MDPSRNGGSAFLRAASILLRHRRLLVGMPLLALVAALGVALLISETGFRAEAKLLPQDATQAGPSSLSQLASQLGLGGGGGLGSPSLYIELLQSRELLRAAVLTDMVVPVNGARDTLRGRLVDILLTEELPTREDSIRAGMGVLENSLELDVAPASGLIEVGVVAPHPELAEAINRRLIDLLERFNLETRQSQARAERRFVESRVAEAEAQLRAAERRLEQFLEQNRRFEEAPQLRIQYLRLQRELDRRQALNTSLAQALEQARIEEVRNTPVFTVIESPENSATAVRNVNIPMAAVMGLLLGLILAIAIAFGRHALTRQRVEHPAEFAEVQALGRRAAAEIGLHRLRRLLPFAGNRNGDRAPAARQEPAAQSTPEREP